MVRYIWFDPLSPSFHSQILQYHYPLAWKVHILQSQVPYLNIKYCKELRHVHLQWMNINVKISMYTFDCIRMYNLMEICVYYLIGLSQSNNKLRISYDSLP